MTSHKAVLSIFTLSTLLIHTAGCASSHSMSTQSTTIDSPHETWTLTSPEAHSTFEINDLKSLRDTLLDQHKRDQDLRTKYSETFSHTEHLDDSRSTTPENGRELLGQLWAVDQESTELIKAMMDQYGWPSYDMIGEEAADAAWLLAQHADADPELQEQVLKLMKPLVEQSQADGRLYAMLTDRVLMNKREPQIYGTQFLMDDKGVLRPVPVEDFEYIDERRASVGLSTIKEYAAYFASFHNHP